MKRIPFINRWCFGSGCVPGEYVGILETCKLMPALDLVPNTVSFPDALEQALKCELDPGKARVRYDRPEAKKAMRLLHGMVQHVQPKPDLRLTPSDLEWAPRFVAAEKLQCHFFH